MSDQSIEVLPPSWMSLYIETYFNETFLSNATGFVLESKNNFYLITNRHVLTGRHQDTDEPLHSMKAIPNKIKIYLKKLRQDGAKGTWVPVEIDLYSNLTDTNSPVWLEHPKYNKAMDVVAILLTYNQEIDYTPYPINEDFDIKVQPSDYLSVIGFPFGKSSSFLLGIWSTGFVASDLEINHKDLPIFLIDCRTREGQSGSPVIICRNSGIYISLEGKTKIVSGTKYKILGVYSGRMNDDSDLGFVWKIEEVLKIIQHDKKDSH